MKLFLMTLILACISPAAFAMTIELSPVETAALEQYNTLHESELPQFDVENKAEIKTEKSKILIAGDSWAFFSCIYNSLGKTIRDRKADLVEDNRCWRTSKLGVEASEWMTKRAHRRVLKYIKNTPRIKYLYLSLGGNDLMNNWNKDFTPAQEIALFEKTTQHLKKITDSYLAVRPDLTIIIAGYDFPNFTFKFTLPFYRSKYKSMGRPTTVRMNQALIDFTQYVTRLADGSNIFYIHSIGLSHYYDGVRERGITPFQTTPPENISPIHNPGLVGGIVNTQTSRKSMIDWLFILRDAFHLNTRMYRNVMHHAYDNLIVHLLERDRPGLPLIY